ncbi:MAG: hypothetical protein AB7O78_17675 [Thermoleophilia bacterium]
MPADDGMVVRLGVLVDAGWTVTLGRRPGSDETVCVIEDRHVRVGGRGPSADAAAAAALASLGELADTMAANALRGLLQRRGTAPG